MLSLLFAFFYYIPYPLHIQLYILGKLQKLPLFKLEKSVRISKEHDFTLENEILTVIKERRTIREFLPKAIEEEGLNIILEVGSSVAEKQSLIFVVSKNLLTNKNSERLIFQFCKGSSINIRQSMIAPHHRVHHKTKFFLSDTHDGFNFRAKRLRLIQEKDPNIKSLENPKGVSS